MFIEDGSGGGEGGMGVSGVGKGGSGGEGVRGVEGGSGGGEGGSSGYDEPTRLHWRRQRTTLVAPGASKSAGDGGKVGRR